MRIAAIYIPENSTPYVFGENHEEMTINIGGKRDYEINSINDELKISVIKDNSENFIDNFWGKDIDLVSAIVGANGAGKTSILNLLKEGIWGLDKEKNSKYLEEQKLECCKVIVEEDGRYEIYDSDNIGTIMYYSPFMNNEEGAKDNSNVINLSKYSVMQRDVNAVSRGETSFSSNIEFYNSARTIRFINFIERENIKEFIEEMGLPIFDKIEISTGYFTFKDANTPFAWLKYFRRFDDLKNKEIEQKESEEITQNKSKSEDDNLGYNIRLELHLIHSVISKVHHILDSTSSKYIKKDIFKKTKTQRVNLMK